MRKLKIKPGKFNFTHQNYGDKSISHRVLMLGSLAIGTTQIFNINLGDDVLATAKALVSLGSVIDFDGESGAITVKPLPSAPIDASAVPPDIYCDNSGTSARLLAGVCAAARRAATFHGDASLSRRPMDMLYYLSGMGVEISLLGGELFTIAPPSGKRLTAIDCRIEKPSAQTKSAIIIAALRAEGITHITESAPTRDHTERLVKFMGGSLTVEPNGCITVENSTLKAVKITVPNDFSTAANLIALGCRVGGIELKNVGLNPIRIAFLEMLMQSGAEVKITNLHNEGAEPAGDITVAASRLTPFNVPAAQGALMLDEIPIAALLAATLEGESKFCGLTALVSKETNRLDTVCEMLKSLGCRAEHTASELTVFGTGKIAGGSVNVRGDHRIAMAAIIGGILSETGATVNNADCIGISCPNFLHILGLEK